MFENQEALFVICTSCAIAILAGKLITNWYHQIERRIRLQEASFYVLTRMAEHQGVPEAEIIEAMDHARGHKSLDNQFKK
jgi:hypothetical protein